MMLIDKFGSNKMYLDITLNGASFERQEQYERLYYKKSRQRRKSTEHVPFKKIKRSMQCNMSLLNYVSFFFTKLLVVCNLVPNLHICIKYLMHFLFIYMVVTSFVMFTFEFSLLMLHFFQILG